MKELNKSELTKNYDNDKSILEYLYKKIRILKQEDPKRSITATQKLRDLKENFLHYHTYTVYNILTDNFNKHICLSDLIYKAGNLFPYLVPSHIELEAEEGLTQVEKSGHEIDQGLFLKAVLSDPKCGLHLCDSMLMPEQNSLDLLSEFQKKDEVKLKTLHIRKSGEIAHITFNNQEYLNAEDNQLISDMETAVDLALLDDRVKVSVLRGGVMTHPRYQGKRVFSAGINLIHLNEGKISFIDFILKRELGYISKIAHGIYVGPHKRKNIQKPWIAAVDSFAIGGGMQLLLVCDKVIGEKDSFICLPAAHEGIIPGVANFRLPQIIGGRLTRQILLAGKKITADDEYGHLFFDEAVDSELMDTRIELSCHELNNPSVIENRKILSNTIESRDEFRKYMAHFSYAQASCMFSEMILKNVGKFSQRKRNTNKQYIREGLN